VPAYAVAAEAPAAEAGAAAGAAPAGPALAAVGLVAHSAGSIYSSGADAGGDALELPIEAPDRCQALAPFQIGAAVFLSSCEYFLIYV